VTPPRRPERGGAGSIGYSGTPLAKKLGLAPGLRVLVLGTPRPYREIVAPLPEGVELVERPSRTTDLVHLFVTQRADLARRLAALRRQLRSDAALWVSWPKKSANVATGVTEGVVRELALPLGWVDVKVCAVDAVWSGLKLVVRKELR